MADSPPSESSRSFRFFDAITAVFVTVLIATNLVAPKLVQVGPFVYGCAIFLFPISYIFGDVLTEVYGYARSRRVIWLGFACAAFASFIFWLSDIMPAAPSYVDQQACFHSIFGQVPRIVAASLFAYLCGEFVNSYVLAKIKLATQGRFLWMRTISSTVVGQLIDSVIFYPLAFWGTWEPNMVWTVAITNYVIKVLVETGFTPFTYLIVNYVKKAEQEDFYDYATDFNPLRIRAN